jgi:hypothetical protein
MSRTIRTFLLLSSARLLALSAVLSAAQPSPGASDPPAINPFGPAPSVREDAVPGYVETSDGAIYPGQLYLTRDVRLKIFDEKLQRQREVPWRAVTQIQCQVKREWLEKEWEFKQAASSEKVFTGRSYPAREYLHTITLRDGRTITGPLSAIVYVQSDGAAAGQPGGYPARAKPEQYLLHKRDKGKTGDDLKSLVYVKLIKLGDEALAEGRKKAAEHHSRRTKPRMQSGREPDLKPSPRG